MRGCRWYASTVANWEVAVSNTGNTHLMRYSQEKESMAEEGSWDLQHVETFTGKTFWGK